MNTVVFSMSSMVSATALIMNAFKDFRELWRGHRPRRREAFHWTERHVIPGGEGDLIA